VPRRRKLLEGISQTKEARSDPHLLVMRSCLQAWM
jgi:hypothetical protein